MGLLDFVKNVLSQDPKQTKPIQENHIKRSLSDDIPITPQEQSILQEDINKQDICENCISAIQNLNHFPISIIGKYAYCDFSKEHYVYMQVIGANLENARNSISAIGEIISNHTSISTYIPNTLNIDTDKILFSNRGNFETTFPHSYFELNPLTKNGKQSKYPIVLHFSTKLGYNIDETHGEIFYMQDGTIGKAHVNLWRNKVGYFYDFKLIGTTLVISKIKTTAVLDTKRLPTEIYKA